MSFPAEVGHPGFTKMGVSELVGRSSGLQMEPGEQNLVRAIGKDGMRSPPESSWTRLAAGWSVCDGQLPAQTCEDRGIQLVQGSNGVMGPMAHLRDCSLSVPE